MKFVTKGKKNICTRGRTQREGNTITSQYPGRRTWGKMKDDRVGY